MSVADRVDVWLQFNSKDEWLFTDPPEGGAERLQIKSRFCTKNHTAIASNMDGIRACALSMLKAWHCPGNRHPGSGRFPGPSRRTYDKKIHITV
jgi:hypothetical protein